MSNSFEAGALCIAAPSPPPALSPDGLSRACARAKTRLRRDPHVVLSQREVTSQAAVRAALLALRVLIKKELPPAPPPPARPAKCSAAERKRRLKNQARLEAWRAAQGVEAAVPRQGFARGAAFALVSREAPLFAAVLAALRSLKAGRPFVLHVPRVMRYHPVLKHDLPYLITVMAQLAKPFAGTTGAGSAAHRTAFFTLDGVVRGGTERRVAPRVLQLLRTMDDFFREVATVAALLLVRGDEYGIDKSWQPKGAVLEAAVRHHTAETNKLMTVVDYEQGGTIEAHKDPTKVLTFITSATLNRRRRTLFQYYECVEDEAEGRPAGSIGYSWFDLVLFEAGLWHKTAPFQGKRSIINLFW